MRELIPQISLHRAQMTRPKITDYLLLALIAAGVGVSYVGLVIAIVYFLGVIK